MKHGQGGLTDHTGLLLKSWVCPAHRVPGVAPARRDTVPLGLIEVVLMDVGMPKWAVRCAPDEFAKMSVSVV